jgi:hypothetical protein
MLGLEGCWVNWGERAQRGRQFPGKEQEMKDELPLVPLSDAPTYKLQHTLEAALKAQVARVGAHGGQQQP